MDPMPESSVPKEVPYLKAFPWTVHYRYRRWWHRNGHWGKEEEGHKGGTTQIEAMGILSDKFREPGMQILEAHLYHKGKYIRSFTSTEEVRTRHKELVEKKYPYSSEVTMIRNKEPWEAIEEEEEEENDDEQMLPINNPKPPIILIDEENDRRLVLYI